MIANEKVGDIVKRLSESGDVAALVVFERHVQGETMHVLVNSIIMVISFGWILSGERLLMLAGILFLVVYAAVTVGVAWRLEKFITTTWETIIKEDEVFQ